MEVKDATGRVRKGGKGFYWKEKEEDEGWLWNGKEER